jgi:hypothetical protein
MTVPVPDQLDAETVLAVIGVDKILAGDPKFGQTERQKALAMPKDIRAAVNRFLSSNTLDEAAPLPDFDYRSVAKLLENFDPDDPKPEQRVFELLPGDLGLEVNTLADKIAAKLEERFPRVIRKSSVKADVDPPSDSELAAFARGWFVANDPMIVIRDLNEGSVSFDEVEALAEFYPGLYQRILDTVDACTDGMRARRPGWDLTYDRDQILRTLTGKEAERQSLFSDFEGVFAQAQQQEAPKPSRGKTEQPPLQTPGQAP